MDMCANGLVRVFIIPSSVLGRVIEASTLVIRNTPSVHVLLSNTICHLKEPGSPEILLSLGLRQGIFKISMNYLVM